MAKLDLAGLWSLSCDKPGFHAIPAQVPGDNYSALLDAGLIPDPNIGMNERNVQWPRDYRWTWRRTFELDSAFLAQGRIWLNIDSFDTVGEVRINSQAVAVNEDMFLRLRCDVKPFLKKGINVIEAIISRPEEYIDREKAKLTLPITRSYFDRKVDGHNLIRKVQCQGGWDWGICLYVSGLYGNIYLEGATVARLEHICTVQKHTAGRCILSVDAELDSIAEAELPVSFSFNGENRIVPVRLSHGLNVATAEFEVENPRLWYPAGYGKQELYELRVAADGSAVTRRIALRDLKAISEEDEYGRSLKIRVNGIDIFAKGANWIPLDSRPQTYTRERYNKLLSAAVAANMNCLRVWGGGLYEFDDFYDLCDEKGLLIWQDCMFACSLYRTDEPFLDLISREIEYQVKRLRDHGSIALWCGDNECGDLVPRALADGDLNRVLWYDRFNQTVGKAVRKADPTRLFWPTSPCDGPDAPPGRNTASRGDMHNWSVWHGGKGFDAYYDLKPRFCSEFGFQSFPAQNTVDWFTERKTRNVTSPVMEFHQRNPAGNSKIVEMFTRCFRFPETFEDFIYLSQVQQAIAIKIGVEYWRTLKPLCMGTIYWQLNDNWPVASWSSLDYFGSWKQLHYHARRFFAPVIGTVIHRAEGFLELRVSSDVGETLTGICQLSAFTFSGAPTGKVEIPVQIGPYEAAEAERLPINRLVTSVEHEFLYLELELHGSQNLYRYRNETFLAEYKKCELAQAHISSEISGPENGVWQLRLATDHPAFYVFAEFQGIQAVFSDNSFTLLPGRPITLTFQVEGTPSRSDLKAALIIRHLQGCYAD